MNPVTSLRVRRALARLAREDHWDHPSQAEERSRNGKFTPEAERKLRELLAEGIARHNAGLPADAARPGTEPVHVIKTGKQPYAEITGVQLAAYQAAAASEMTAPSFAAGRSVAPVTAPMVALHDSDGMPWPARPYVPRSPLDPGTPVWPGSRPVIGDSMPPLPAEPQQGTLFEAAPPPPLAVLYTAPGWAGLQMSRWVARGEWDDVQVIADRGMGRNAADMVAGFRHNRARVAEGFVQRCAAIGRPGLAGPVLRRTRELVEAARAAAAEKALAEAGAR